MKNLCLFALILVFASGSWMACEPETVRLSWSHKKIVDSIATKRKGGIRSEYDSLCNIRIEKELQQKVDSIVEERMAEIQRKIEADAKNN